MEWFRDQRVRRTERKVTFYQEKMSNLKKFAICMKEKRNIIKLTRSESQ